MEEQFLNYQQALALKELGYDEETFGFYEKGKFVFFYDTYDNYELLLNCYAPLKQQAFRWFRKNYGLNVIIDQTQADYRSAIQQRPIVHYYHIDKCFETYEEAEDACINKLIEIAKKNKL
jgi:hypothetical protein